MRPIILDYFFQQIVWENMAPGTELLRIFCAGIGPLQLGAVLDLNSFHFSTMETKMPKGNGWGNVFRIYFAKRPCFMQ